LEKVTAIFKENALVARSNGQICEISPNLGSMSRSQIFAIGEKNWCFFPKLTI
jgi:hypothetical protein